jgi:hypothetical protein
MDATCQFSLHARGGEKRLKQVIGLADDLRIIDILVRLGFVSRCQAQRSSLTLVSTSAGVRKVSYGRAAATPNCSAISLTLSFFIAGLWHHFLANVSTIGRPSSFKA